ncbi:MAG: hypothetical protein ACTHY0_09315 [Mammaliicoccus vitulinus]
MITKLMGLPINISTRALLWLWYFHQIDDFSMNYDHQLYDFDIFIYSGLV